MEAFNKDGIHALVLQISCSSPLNLSIFNLIYDRFNEEDELHEISLLFWFTINFLHNLMRGFGTFCSILKRSLKIAFSAFLLVLSQNGCCQKSRNCQVSLILWILLIMLCRRRWKYFLRCSNYWLYALRVLEICCKMLVRLRWWAWSLLCENAIEKVGLDLLLLLEKDGTELIAFWKVNSYLKWVSIDFYATIFFLSSSSATKKAAEKQVQLYIIL